MIKAIIALADTKADTRQLLKNIGLIRAINATLAAETHILDELQKRAENRSAIEKAENCLRMSQQSLDEAKKKMIEQRSKVIAVRQKIESEYLELSSANYTIMTGKKETDEEYWSRNAFCKELKQQVELLQRQLGETETNFMHYAKQVPENEKELEQAEAELESLQDEIDELRQTKQGEGN